MPLVVGREDTHIERRQGGPHVLPKAQKPNLGQNIEISGESLQLGAKGTFSHHQQDGSLAKVG